MFNKIYDKHAYQYGSGPKLDFVADFAISEELKAWDPTIYKRSKGFSKKINVDLGLEQIFKFKRCFKSGSNNIHYARALEKVSQRLKTTVPLASFEDVYDQMTLSTAAGFSFPGKSKGDVLYNAHCIAHYMSHCSKNDLDFYQPPCTVSFRGHKREVGDPKTRAVLVMPFESVILESVIGRNLVNHYRDNEPSIFFGKDAMRNLYDTVAVDKSNFRVTLDWSSFDTTIPAFLLDDVFELLRSNINFQKMSLQGKTLDFTERKAAQYHKLFDWVKYNFIHTKIMMPDGTMYQKHAGIPSGSFLTSLVGSISNMIMIETLLSMQHVIVSRIRVLGDDSLVSLQPVSFRHFQYDRLRVDANNFFGTIISDDKMQIADPGSSASFIGYRLMGRKLIRDSIDWFTSAMCPESPVTDPLISASRLAMFYLIGGCNDPQFCAFLRFFTKRRKTPDKIPILAKDSLKWFLENHMDLKDPTIELKYAFEATYGQTTRLNFIRFD